MTQARKRVPNPSYYWTAYEIGRLGTLRASGYTYPFIAEKLGKTLDSVKAQAWRSGLPLIVVPYTKKQDAILTKGWRNGNSIEELAEKTGKTYSSVRMRIQRLGVYRPAGKSRAGKKF